jgi:hypothetical protein
LHLAGIRVEHVAAAAGTACYGLAADEMADLAHGYSPSAPRSHRAAGACFVLITILVSSRPGLTRASIEKAGPLFEMDGLPIATGNDDG